jgi:hypothetical protein
MRRSLFVAPLVGAIGLSAFVGFRPGASPAQPAANGNAVRHMAALLPLSHVVLFSSGVGYFQREGKVDGSARVDLSFPATDVNDLLKSLVLQDTGGGRVTAVNYDSQDPIERTLKTFALDLTANPSLGQLLNQARGEKVEVTLQSSAAGQAGTLSGAILGMESQKQPQGKDAMIDVDILNLVCAEGLRSVPLKDVLRARFLNPMLDAELKRALELIAGGRDQQKKNVSLSFKGDGERGVRVGYVVESPMWKTSYRLVLDANGKAQLQGWAVVENTTDDDWANVRMALVSGRPISYRMDLYPPLYVPRPTVEPERFASLRPPTYGGAMTSAGQPGPANPVPQAAGVSGGINGGIGGIGGIGGGLGGINQTNPNWAFANGSFGFNRYQLGAQFGNLAGQSGLQGGTSNTLLLGDNNNANFGNNGKITFEQLQQRQQELRNNKDQARRIGSALVMLDATQSVASVASAEDIGDVCQYVIEDRVSLPRQKSAMLPIIKQPIDASKVSIFNESVHAKFPLLGLRFKVDASQPLMQGPVTVYDGPSYAGDSRLPDLQPGEERLLSYAIDTGTEVKVEGKPGTDQLAAVKVVKGLLHAMHKQRKSKTYLIKNRSNQDRTLVIEHPYQEGWDLVTPERAAERTRDVYRFHVTVKAGQSARHDVVEENRRVDVVKLSGSNENTVLFFLKSPVPGPKVKEALGKMQTLSGRLTDTRRDLAQAQAQLKEITDDQTRLRANFEKVPPTSAAYKRYLEKFDAQETEIEKLQALIKAKQATEKAQAKELEEYVAALNVE